MGIFPVHCPVCNSYYIPSGETHCQSVERQLESEGLRARKYLDLLDAIVIAYRAGDCKQEILNAAFELGHSVSKKEFKWLDDELAKWYKK